MLPLQAVPVVLLKPYCAGLANISLKRVLVSSRTTLPPTWFSALVVALLSWLVAALALLVKL